GWRKLRLETAAVATRPLARVPAETPAARSISDMIQPPKISPAGLVSAGIATVRSDSSPMGCVAAFVMARSPARISHRAAKHPGERDMNEQSGVTERVLQRRDADGVAWLTLNRPAARNALS